MTQDTTGVLASIDGALRDYGTSGDAMRWAPEREAADGWEVTSGFLAYMDDDGMLHRWPPEPVTVSVTIGGVEMSMTMTPGSGTAPWPPPQSALDHTHRAMLDYLAGWGDRMAHSCRRHRNHCAVCHPAGNPPPSAGHCKPGPKAARMRGRRRR